MPVIRTQYQSHDRLVQNPGDPVKIKYGPKYDDNGRLYLIETGRHNLYAEIQSHAGSVDIHEILRRYVNGQDPGALSRIQGAYGDFTSMPSTFAEALNTMIAAEQYFLTLPLETRAKFNHDFRQFVANFDAPGFLADSGLFDVPSPAVEAGSAPAPAPTPAAAVPPSVSPAPPAAAVPPSASPAPPAFAPASST